MLAARDPFEESGIKHHYAQHARSNNLFSSILETKTSYQYRDPKRDLQTSGTLYLYCNAIILSISFLTKL